MSQSLLFFQPITNNLLNIGADSPSSYRESAVAGDLSLYVLLMRIVSIDGAGLRPFLVHQGEVQFPFHARCPVATHDFGLRPKISEAEPYRFTQEKASGTQGILKTTSH